LEYEEGTSVEANLARQLDKFEMIVQANEYELVHTEKRLDSFFDYTKDYFTHPEVIVYSYHDITEAHNV
jgi:5'-deoxynucleotidase YfbR-like HD superfamily hydrolase